jgi:excisionase family DNA binding protein
MNAMHDASPEPWLIEVPARSIAKTLRSQWQDYTADCEREKGLVMAGTAAKLLGVHRSRVYQLLEAKKLDTFLHFGSHWLSCAQLMHRLTEPPKTGRPVGSLQTA